MTNVTQDKATMNLTLNLLVSDAFVLSWQISMLESLISSLPIKQINWLELPGGLSKPSMPLSLLFKIDSLLSNCQQNTLRRVNISSLTIESNKCNQLNHEDFIENLAKQSDDLETTAVVINLTEKGLSDKLLKAIKHPVFSIFFGQEMRTVSSLTGLNEFISGNKTISSGVQLEQAEGDNRLLFSSTTSIEPPSICRTLETTLEKTAVFMARTVEHYFKQTKNKTKLPVMTADVTSQTSIDTLSYAQLFSLYRRYATRVVKRIVDKLTITEQWIILLGENKANGAANHNLSDFTKIIPPSDEFWADPFLFEYDEKHYLFIEVFPYETELGHISCMQIMDDGTYSEPVKVLQRPYHLSYPNVFEHEGTHYMIPESGDNQTIELYESSDFPYQWKFKHNLMENIRAYDSSLIFHDGLWWLFASVAVNDACPTTEELYLYYADSPISQTWTPHANNPVVSDASSARPAGHLFMQGDQLIRVSQNCAGSYGAGINFCEIQRLNAHEYKEIIVETIEADWDNTLSGVHTFNSDSRFTVSDAIFRRSKRGLKA